MCERRAVWTARLMIAVLYVVQDGVGGFAWTEWVEGFVLRNAITEALRRINNTQSIFSAKPCTHTISTR